MACVEKRGNKYRITVYDGYNLDGKQIKRRKSWEPNPNMTDYQIKKELERQCVLFEQECKHGQTVSGSIKFEEFAKKWFIEYAQTNLRPTTLERYKALTERTYKAIGHIRLDRLRPNDLTKFYISLSGVEPNRKCSYKINTDFKNLLHSKELTYAKLAELSNLGIRTIKSVAHGDIVSNSTANKIAQKLNMKVDELFSEANKASGKLAPKTVKHYHTFITSVLERAVKWGYIYENPCKKIDPPKVDKKQIKCFSTEQAKIFLKGLENECLKYRVIFCILLFTGMRRGELLGLEWSDIDFDKYTVTINRTSLYTVSKGTFTDTTKNEYSLRTIYVSKELIDLLKLYYEEQQREKVALGDLWVDSNRICIQWNGKPMSTNTPYEILQKLLKKYDLPKVSIHSLRHTNATIMIESGTDLKTTSARLGHSQASTTMNIYVHQIKSSNEHAAENISKALAI